MNIGIPNSDLYIEIEAIIFCNEMSIDITTSRRSIITLT